MNNRLVDIFGSAKVLLPVIHAQSLEQVLENIKIARMCDAHGVFVINHNGSSAEVLDWYAEAHHRNPEFWIGLNLLDMSTVEAFDALPSVASGIWADDAGIVEREGGKICVARARDIQDARDRARARGWDGIYFGGVAFKGRPRISNPGLAASHAVPFADVITTSGDHTGMPPSVSKVAQIKERVGTCPVAIASGISLANINHFLPVADAFLVATSVINSDEMFVPVRLQKMANSVRYWR